MKVRNFSNAVRRDEKSLPPCLRRAGDYQAITWEFGSSR